MTHRVDKGLSFSVLTTFGLLILALMPAQGQSRAANAGPPQNPRDLNGVWQAVGSNDITQNLAPGEEISFTAYGAQRYKTVDHMKDPSNWCAPTGFFRALQTAIMPFQIVQNPDVTMIGMEYHYHFRLIYTDGRKHPDDIYDYPEWMGHSVGKWEGSTLVVETIGFNDLTWLDTPGLEHSVKLRTTERFQKTDPKRIKWTVTIDDPLFFTKPFTYVREFARQDTRIMSYSCEENEKDFAHMQSVLGGAHRNKKALRFPN